MVFSGRIIAACGGKKCDYGPGPGKIAGIHNGINLEHLRPDSQPKSGKFTLICVGWLVEKKWDRILTGAFERVRGRKSISQALELRPVEFDKPICIGMAWRVCLVGIENPVALSGLLF